MRNERPFELRRGVLVAFVLFAGVAGTSAARPAAQLPQESDVSRAIAAVEAAEQRRDRDALERLLDTDFQFIHSTGRLEERESFIRRAALGQLASQRMPATLLDARVRQYGDTAVRVTRVRVPPAAASSRASTEIYTSETYVKRNGAWRRVFAQSTEVAAAK